MKHKLIAILMSVILLISVFLVSMVLPKLYSNSKDNDSYDDTNKSIEHLSSDEGSGEAYNINIDLSSKTVLIDCGHGGMDPGKVSKTGLKESEVNLDIGLKLRDLLEKAGVTVLMTRDSEKDLSSPDAKSKKMSDLNARCDIINNCNADAVISIHQNSYTNESVKGAQTFFHKGSDSGEELAKIIQSGFAEVLGSDRESKNDQAYYILMNTNATVAIAECGFLSNQEEAELLSTNEYRQKIAKVLCEGILNYLINVDSR